MLMDKFVIAGPCVIESEYTCMKIADKVKELTAKYGFDYIFKASFDKANRTSVDSYRGPGLQKGLEILNLVKPKSEGKLLIQLQTFWKNMSSIRLKHQPLNFQKLYLENMEKRKN